MDPGNASYPRSGGTIPSIFRRRSFGAYVIADIEQICIRFLFTSSGHCGWKTQARRCISARPKRATVKLHMLARNDKS